MTLYDLLSVLKSNIKITIINQDGEHLIYTDSLALLDEAVKDAKVESWVLSDRVSIKVTLEDSIPSG